jgi:hypothetical protein
MRTVLLAFLALAWLPLTSHCKLAALFDSDFLRCHPTAHASKDGNEPCHEEACCQLESPKYHLPRQQEIIPVIGNWVLSADELVVSQSTSPPDPKRGLLTAAPPDLPSSWQFTLRTALPVRAPASAS